MDQGDVEGILCLTKHPSLLQLQWHLAEHQAEISLFALPSYVLKDDNISEKENAADEVSSPDDDTSDTGRNPRAALGRYLGPSDINSNSENTEDQITHVVHKDGSASESYLRPGLPGESDEHDVRDPEADLCVDELTLFDNKGPTWHEVGRLIEPNGGSESLSEHGLWSNLGFDLDLGRELTRTEVTHIQEIYLAAYTDGLEDVVATVDTIDGECISCERSYVIQETFTTLDKAMNLVSNIRTRLDWAESKADGTWKTYLRSLSSLTLTMDYRCAQCVLRGLHQYQQ